jgi:hypothetical protein
LNAIGQHGPGLAPGEKAVTIIIITVAMVAAPMVAAMMVAMAAAARRCSSVGSVKPLKAAIMCPLSPPYEQICRAENRPERACGGCARCTVVIVMAVSANP